MTAGDNRYLAGSRVAAAAQTVAATVMLLFCAFDHHTLGAQANDFAFRFRVGDCLPERLDTFSGTFTKDLGGYPPQLATTRLALTNAQMTDIFRTIEEIRFFEYPASFVGIAAGAAEIVKTIPSPTYRLEVRNAGVVHTVTWEDAYKPTTAEADRLRNLFEMIIGFIHAHEDYKRLPPVLVGCE